MDDRQPADHASVHAGGVRPRLGLRHRGVELNDRLDDGLRDGGPRESGCADRAEPRNRPTRSRCPRWPPAAVRSKRRASRRRPGPGRPRWRRRRSTASARRFEQNVSRQGNLRVANPLTSDYFNWRLGHLVCLYETPGFASPPCGWFAPVRSLLQGSSAHGRVDLRAPGQMYEKRWKGMARRSGWCTASCTGVGV